VPLNKNIKLIINYLLGPLVLLFLFYSIDQQIHRQPQWRESLHQIWMAVQDLKQGRIWLVLLLMPVNWGLETLKWQLASRNFLNLPFGKAYKAILAGIAIGSFTFNRMGEYLGRILYVQQGKRVQSIPFALVGSMAQLITTLLGGWVGIFLLKAWQRQQMGYSHSVLSLWLTALQVATALAALVMIVVYFRLSRAVRWFEKLKWHKATAIVKDLQQIKDTVLFQIMFLSFARYLVFIVQYFLLFSVFGVSLSWGQTFMGTSVMFLIVAVIPTFTFLADLGIRWEAGIQIIGLFNPNTTGIFAVSLGIWLINLAIPALMGSLLILGIKLFKTK
jgi:hypothetical protein